MITNLYLHQIALATNTTSSPSHAFFSSYFYPYLSSPVPQLHCVPHYVAVSFIPVQFLTCQQIHGGHGYSRHVPFEHIYRHHRRYRITEGSEEIQMRKVAAYMFGYKGVEGGRKESDSSKL